MRDSRKLLLAFSIKYKGDWEKIYENIMSKSLLSEQEIDDLTNNVTCPFVTIIDEEYPASLKDKYRPPFVLFYRGNLSLLYNEKIISIVGSREASEYGLRKTKEVASELAKEGYTIVSGLAKGIDAAALKSALPYGKSVAFLGNGIDYYYPKINFSLQKEMFTRGLVISEYPLGVEPQPDNFRMRNRLIALSSKALLVAEAYERSGTLITVTFAAEAGKDIMCFPYSVDEERVSACNSLIKEGAYLVESASDVIFNISNSVVNENEKKL